MIKLKNILLENDSKDRGGVLYSWNGKYLLCKGESSGKWHVPKGHIKEGESSLDGSVREFLEETEISLPKIPELLDSWNSKGGKFYLYELLGNRKLTPVLNHEHTDWGYFESYDLPSPIDKDIKKNIEKKLNMEEGSPTSNIKGLKGATGFIKPEEWESKKKSLEKNILSSTGYKMIKLKPLLERVDYHDTASQLVKQYGLKSKIKMGKGKDFGEYVPETDTITLRPSYPNMKEFLMTILHEIGHALDAKRLGVNKYMKKYVQAGTMATYNGLDPHDDNKWEEKAEKFAEKELKKWL
jgi:8-oxo-dGTP pyrophosphatase MutT (NUDIX family)